MFGASSIRSLLAVAALAVLMQLAFNVDTTTAQTTQGSTAASTAAGTNAPTTAPVTTAVPEANRTKIRYEVVMVHEGISVWAILLMVTIMVADKCKSYGVVKYTAIIGPFGCMILAGAVMLLACLPSYNNGNNQQEGFTSALIQASICAALAFFASFSAFSTRKHIGDVSMPQQCFPYGCMSLLCSVGLIPAIGGTIYAALNVAEGYQWPGMILGSVCCGEMLILIIWYVTYSIKGKGSGSKVCEDPDGVKMEKS